MRKYYNKRTDQTTTLQDDTSSQTSIRELKEEDLHFQVAYELNDEENETICFDCNKYVFLSVCVVFKVQVWAGLGWAPILS